MGLFGGKKKKKRRKERKPPGPIRQAIAKFIFKLPFLRNAYAKNIMKMMQSAPKGQLPPELEHLRNMLQQVPPKKREKAIQAALKGDMPTPDALPSRAMRRQAERSARPKRK